MYTECTEFAFIFLESTRKSECLGRSTHSAYIEIDPADASLFQKQVLQLARDWDFVNPIDQIFNEGFPPYFKTIWWGEGRGSTGEIIEEALPNLMNMRYHSSLKSWM